MNISHSVSAVDRVLEIGTRGILELAIKHNPSAGLGKIITRLDSPDLIAGVAVEPLHIHADDRGFFAELARLGSGKLAGWMIPEDNRRIQVSAALTYPGVIKAIHYHFEQTDLWAPISGMFQVFLADFRRHSSTFGLINTLYVGTLRPWKILIPPGVGHGYKVLGTEPGQLVYLTDSYYNPEDEGRLPYNHPNVGYDWELQHK